MYTAYFGFDSKPFRSKDPKGFYRNINLDAACADILDGIRERRGFMLLTGEAGVGKTSLFHRCVAEAGDIRFILLNGDDFDSSGADFDFPDILDHLCTNLKLQFTGLDTERRSRLLLEAVAARVRRHQAVALWIDDAHRLPVDVLPCLQAFVETPAIPFLRLQVVLAGLPELASELDRPKWRGLGNCIRVRCRLERLSELETGLFIGHQLRVAGYAGGELFSPAAIQRICTYCQGVPRAIAILCDTILLFASLQSERVITAELVDAAAQTCFLGELSESATQTGGGQPGGTAAPETSLATATEHRDFDLDLSQFDFSFDLNEHAMSAKQPAKIPLVEGVTQGTAVAPPPMSPSTETHAATTAEQVVDVRSLEPWQGMTTDVADAVSFVRPAREPPVALLPMPEVGRYQLGSVDVLLERDQRVGTAERSTVPLGGSPQADPRIDTGGLEPRRAESSLGDAIHGVRLTDDARDRNKLNALESLGSVSGKYPWLTRLISQNTERENPMSRLDNLNKILKNLQNESPGVEASALISEDGLMMASALPQDLDETRVAGMTATLLNLGTRAANELRRGDVEEVIVRGEHGYAVMISAGRGALLLVLANENTKLGLIFFDMREAIKAIKNVL